MDGKGKYVILPKSIRHDASLLEVSDLYIGPDSFYLHVAAAVDTPSVALLNLNSHMNITRYYEKAMPIESPVDCAPCGRISTECDHGPMGFIKCMEAISPQLVLSKVKKEHERWRKEAGPRKTQAIA